MADDSRKKEPGHETLAVDLPALIEADDRVGTLNGLAWDVANALDQLDRPAPQTPPARGRQIKK